MKTHACLLSCILASLTASVAADLGQLETQFRELPMEARRLTGPLFWMHGDENETKERLEFYLEKVAEGGNGCFTAESRPHSDWLGPRWYSDLDICLQKAKALDLQMWIFDERWWPSQSIGGKVLPRYAAKNLGAEAVDVQGPRQFEADGYGGERYIAAVAGRLNGKNEIEGDSLLDLAPFITDGKLSWKAPAGNWQVIKFTHQQAPGLGQRGGKELSIDGASRDCTEWFLQTVYQPHYDRFGEDFGKTIPGFFYDEPETKGDWGTELPVILKEWGIDWKKAYVGYKFTLAGDDGTAARYQYMEAIAEAWGRVMYGGMTEWCEQRNVLSIGHFMEHGNLYLHPTYCAGDMMRVQKYSSMGGIDMVVRQLYPGQRKHDIYQTPKLGSSISHVYGKKDDLAMCEIFGGYNQVLTYPQMKWLTDQHQVRGINFMIPHSFNPKAPRDRDYPPYFYNDGREPRWPLYRVYADYTSRLSLMLTGGHHVCPVAVLFSGNARRVGRYVTPEDMTTVLQDALYDCDWLPFEAFENLAAVDGKDLALHQERYQVLIVPPTELIPHATLAKVKEFFDQGGVVLGYGHLPTVSGTLGTPSTEIGKLRDAIWGSNPKVGTKACKTSPAGGRSYFLPEKPDVAAISAALHQDAGIAPVIEVLDGETDHWLHVLHRVKDDRDVFLICNQDHENAAKTFRLKVTADGFPEIWDAMRNDISSADFIRHGKSVEFPLTLEPLESVLLVFHPEKRDLPTRLTPDALQAATPITVTGSATQSPPLPKLEGRVTLSPVVGNPFSGTCQIPGGHNFDKSRLFLEMDGLSPEGAARVTINGKDAGGFIGKPFRLDVTRHLKPGNNTIDIAPFAPESVRVRTVTAATARSYHDGRPAATLRMDAKDHGIVLRHGDGPDKCDLLGARDVWVYEDDGTYYMHYDAAGPKGWLCSLATSRDLLTWEKKGPILDFGKPGQDDSKGACYGVTYQDGDDWHMFYLGTPNVTPPPNLIPGFPYLTMKARGSSPAGPWVKQKNVVPFRTKPGTYYSITASPGHVIRNGDEYLQFFSATTRKPGNRCVQRTLGIARTKNLDGPWTVDPQPMVPIEEQIENSTLYFEENNQTWFLFTNHIGIDQGEYTDAIWVYWSTDLNKWDAANKANVLDGENCTWSTKCIGLPSVVPVGKRLALFYDAPGSDSTSHMKRHIGLAWLKLPLSVPGSPPPAP